MKTKPNKIVTALLLAGFIAAVLLLAGCGSFGTPRVSGGRSSVALGDGTKVEARQGDNAETPTTQTIVRESRRTLPSATATAGAPTAPGEPTRLAQFAPLMEEVHTERIETTVGATQDVARIQKVMTAHRPIVAAVLLGVLMAWAAWRAYTREWPLMAVVLGAGSLVCFLTLNPWWGVAGAVLSLIVWIAYTFAKASNPVVAAVASAAESAVKRPGE